MVTRQKSTIICLCILLIVCLAYGNCHGSNFDVKAGDFLGIKVNGANAVKKLKVTSYDKNGTLDWNLEYDKGASDPDILAWARINWTWGLKKIIIQVCNMSNKPILTNYFTDKFNLVTKDGKTYEIGKGNVARYPSRGYINPNTKVTYEFQYPDVRKEDVEVILCSLGMSDEITVALKPVPKIKSTPK